MSDNGARALAERLLAYYSPQCVPPDRVEDDVAAILANGAVFLPDAAELRAALEAAERVKASAIENGGRLTPGAILDIQVTVAALRAALAPEGSARDGG